VNKPTKPQAEVLALIGAGHVEFYRYGGGKAQRFTSTGVLPVRVWNLRGSAVANVIAKGWSTGPDETRALYRHSTILTLTPAGEQALDSTRKDKP